MSNVISQYPITSLTRHQLVFILHDILEHNFQYLKNDGSCPWCGNEEYPVNKNGEAIQYTSDNQDEEPYDYDVDHDKECAVSLIQSVFNGTYKYMNAPRHSESDIPHGMREAAADVQHQIWAHWMKYVFSICPQQEDGSVVIPAEKVERWKRQIDTPYQELSEKEKESDGHQADKVLSALNVIWGM